MLPSTFETKEKAKRWGASMWKVRRVEDGDRIVLSLSGRLEGEQLSELEEVLAAETAIQSLILDLQDVRLVDQDAVSFLAHCEAGGASLRNCPAYIRGWIGAVQAARESLPD